MKCLPLSKISEAQDYVLHDWHAEILVLRAFNHFLLQECLRMTHSPEHDSSVLQWRHRNSDSVSCAPFTIRDDVEFHMYCSEAPCGDASMELVMEAQEDASPWPIESHMNSEQSLALLGRGDFSKLGIVRRKPGNEIDLELSLLDNH